MRWLWGVIVASALLAAPASAATNHQNAHAMLRLDGPMGLTRMLVDFVPPPGGEGLAVQVVAGGRGDLSQLRILLNECDDSGCRFLRSGEMPRSGIAEVSTGGGFRRDGQEDLLVRLRHAGEDVASVRLTHHAWRGGDTLFGVRTFPSTIGTLRRLRVDVSPADADRVRLRTRAAMRGPQTTRALLFAQPSLFADQIQAGGLRSERRLSSGLAEHELDGPMEMRGGDLLQVVGELRHRSRPPADGRGVFRITLPRPRDVAF